METVLVPCTGSIDYLSSVQSLSCVQLFATPWTAAHQASLSILSFQAVTYDMASPLGTLKFCPTPPIPSLQVFLFPSARPFFLQSLLLIHQYRACF